MGTPWRKRPRAASKGKDKENGYPASPNPTPRATPRARGARPVMPFGDKAANERTVEEIYQKRTQHEHILLRPDSYVGSTEKQSQEHWILDEEGVSMQRRVLD